MELSGKFGETKAGINTRLGYLRCSSHYENNIVQDCYTHARSRARSRVHVSMAARTVSMWSRS